jgi:hypothetical protein
LVSVTRKPTFDVEDVGRILTMPERNTVPHVDLEDQNESDPTAGRIRRLTDLD